MKTIEMKGNKGLFSQVNLHWKRFKLASMVLIGVMAVMYFNDPIMFLRHKKMAQKYQMNRQRKLKYAYITETRGSLFADFAKTGDTWKDNGRVAKKMGRDFMSIFK